MKISQTHQMKVIFWITLPILLVSMGLIIATSDTKDFYSQTPPILIILGVMFLLFNIKLKWELTENEFSFVYKPFIWKPKSIPINQIAKLEICKINPLKDFGGWGLRYSRKYGKAYTTEGNIVLRLYLKTGKILNFTATKNPELELLIDSISNKTLD